jgi:hypothetical protein
MSDGTLPFAEVIRALRIEILEAAKGGEDENVRFRLGSIEMEFHVVVKREGGPNAQIKFGVPGIGLDVGVSGKLASEHAQKVKLTLSPIEIATDGTEKEVEIARVQSRKKNR